MKPLLLSIAAFMSLLSFSAPAAAAEAYATTAIHMRAGPDSGYPVVVTLQRGEQVELLDCIEGAEWCEVETSYGERGWVASYYLQTSYNGQALGVRDFAYDGGTTIVIYNAAPYWDRYYRTKYFYKDRDRWTGGHDGHGHSGNGHNWNDGHGHGDGNGNGNGNGNNHDRPPAAQKPAQPAYLQKQQPARGGYNPLCRIGQNNC